MDKWLASDQAARICGLDFRPQPHPALPDTAKCTIKGQGSVFFLLQVPQGNIWLLKKFAPSRRPSDDYLKSVTRYLPGGAEFFTCTQRRILTSNHLDLRNSYYKNPDFADWLAGSILMPKVPGTPWASMADDLREGNLELSIIQRLQVSLNLVKCIALLEKAQCSHRDLSSTNVFVTIDGRVFLIDWDCMYHPQLPFQLNTTSGTMGYIAPFIKIANRNSIASASWCEHADRFALAVLIAEILLIGPDTPLPHEDGTLFSQSQIEAAGNNFIRGQIEQLRCLSKPCTALLKKAFIASTFQECPSPVDWEIALKYSLHKQRPDEGLNPQHIKRSRIMQVLCDNCHTQFQISEEKCNSLKRQGKSILCNSCLAIQFNVWSMKRIQHNMTFPQVSCEHCQQLFRISREKLDVLREQAKPILCSQCLTEQLRQWHAESVKYEQDHPKVKCANCTKSFRIRKDKLDSLSAEGKKIFCKDCLETKIRHHSDYSRTDRPVRTFSIPPMPILISAKPQPATVNAYQTPQTLADAWELFVQVSPFSRPVTVIIMIIVFLLTIISLLKKF
jgi:serine/threonine protein kinase